MSQAVSGAADAALQAVAQRYTIARGAADGATEQLEVEGGQMEIAGDEVNQLDAEGFAVSDRSSFFAS